ncbi:hypothetical protein BBBOND_0405740 [Babesia bigemina]|uniref:Sugar phosphate transporter domain-containing protein n=1 Tax=Babesia bigemina TaxID=5866 RepID=A0A061DEY5_BABBI|nr:hypothetical protein BBBOND_0405740 [Babesia bigemina]CDR98090.1 hypothetical protein BBBOND_0405740 [Babesia bigemina]|eukprot:XP_012770276.1 hypothetical protein BBBOND_0405740 [Babesia bigemina]
MESQKAYVIVRFIDCGLMYYVYNYCEFYCLELMNQVTQCVLNTMTHIAVIAVSIITFKNHAEVMGNVGMGAAIVACLLYWLAKQSFCASWNEVTAVYLRSLPARRQQRVVVEKRSPVSGISSAPPGYLIAHSNTPHVDIRYNVLVCVAYTWSRRFHKMLRPNAISA